MKRYFIALGAAAFVGSTVLASAAALDLSGGVVQTGSADATCDADGVTVVHKWEGDEGGTPYSMGANVTGIATECEGQYVSVHAFDENDNLLGEYATTIGGTSATGNWGSNIPLDVIEYTNVTITS